MINITSDFEKNSKRPGAAGASAILLQVFCMVLFNLTGILQFCEENRGVRGTFEVNSAAINLNSVVNSGISEKVLTDKLEKILKQMQ